MGLHKKKGLNKMLGWVFSMKDRPRLLRAPLYQKHISPRDVGPEWPISWASLHTETQEALAQLTRECNFSSELVLTRRSANTSSSQPLNALRTSSWVQGVVVGPSYGAPSLSRWVTKHKTLISLS